jgi:molecular chaperone GrpE
MTDPTARAHGAAAAQPEDQPAPERDPLAEAAREVAEYKDKLLRALAEMENLRKRTEREVADARFYGIASFARDVLGIADNMRRAREAVAPELSSGPDNGVKALLEGVELTERELNKVLEKHGIRKFEPVGEKFDPNFHQAMYEHPEASVPPGHVANVIQSGYKIGERVLRPAMVAVAKAAPQPAPEAPANDDADAATSGPRGNG